MSEPAGLDTSLQVRAALLLTLGLAGCASVPRVAPVNFATDADQVTDAAVEAQVEQVLAALRDDPDLHVALIGHADEDHTDEYNRELSRRRAEHLRERLLARAPELDPRIHVEARGEWDASERGVDDESKARNRRVELRFFYPRVCEPSFDASFLACEWARLPDPEPELAVETPSKPPSKPPNKPPAEPPWLFRGAYVYGLAGYAISSDRFLRQHVRWGASGGWIWGWDSEFRVSAGLSFDHLVDVAPLFPVFSDCEPFCGAIDRSHVRVVPELRFGGASRRIWAWVRVNGGLVLSHRERQLAEVSGGPGEPNETVATAPERWFAGGVLGLGPGIGIALTDHLFLVFDATISYSAVGGFSGGSGIYDTGVGLGWVF